MAPEGYEGRWRTGASLQARRGLYRWGVFRLDAATVLLQWAVGILGFCWVTTRHRQVGLGYGWLLRGTGVLVAAAAVVTGFRYHRVWGRDIGSLAVVVASAVALATSIVRRRAGVSGRDAEHDRRTAEVAAMTGIERGGNVDTITEQAATTEFNPALDLVAPAVGLIGLIVGGIDAVNGGFGPTVLSVARVLSGALFLGAVTDAMLLGHWYLVQPGLPRRLLSELVRLVAIVWPIEVALLLMPTGMLSVFTGAIDDGWNGMLGWMWLACAITTLVLTFVTRAALKERAYSAVMAATGLLYLAILTGFGTDLVARAVLSGA